MRELCLKFKESAMLFRNKKIKAYEYLDDLFYKSLVDKLEMNQHTDFDEGYKLAIEHVIEIYKIIKKAKDRIWII